MTRSAPRSTEGGGGGGGLVHRGGGVSPQRGQSGFFCKTFEN